MHRAWLAALQSMGGIPAGQIGWYIWPDGGMTPFRSTKGTTYEGGMRVPCIVRWPGKIKPGMVENGIFSGLDWLPTLAAAAGNPNITQQLLQGVTLGGRNYKNHLDGYNQMDLLLGTGPSARHEIFYFGGPKLGAIRIDDFKFQFFQQPNGWPGEKLTTDMPTPVNIRQDPFERTPSVHGESFNNLASGYFNDFMGRQLWRFVYVQRRVAELAQTASTTRLCRHLPRLISTPSRLRLKTRLRPIKGISETGPASAPSRALAVFSVMSASLIGRFWSSTSDCPPLQFRCRSRRRLPFSCRGRLTKAAIGALGVRPARDSASGLRTPTCPHFRHVTVTLHYAQLSTHAQTPCLDRSFR
jgi:hypothetical protein